jgi:hypothetical protein
VLFVAMRAANFAAEEAVALLAGIAIAAAFLALERQTHDLS